MSDLTPEAVRLLVEEQLKQITDPLVLETLSAMLVTPTCHERRWFDGANETYRCWAIAEDDDSGTEYVYWAESYFHSSCWGIVFAPDDKMGMDSNWFQTLERAFYDSFAAVRLPIWRVIQRGAADEHKEIAGNMSWDEAAKVLRQFQVEGAVDLNTTYRIEPRTQEFKWW